MSARWMTGEQGWAGNSLGTSRRATGTRARRVTTRRRAELAASRHRVAGCIEGLEARTLFNAAAPEIDINYPRPVTADTVTMLDGDGPFFRYAVGDNDGLSSVTVRVTQDGNPTPVYERTYTNVPFIPSTDVFTNPFGLGTFHMTVDATDNAPPADRLSSSRTRSLVVVDDDTTPPSVAFTEPRLDPMTDGDWEPFK